MKSKIIRPHSIILVTLAVLLSMSSRGKADDRELKKDNVGGQSMGAEKFPEFSWDHIPRYMHIYKSTSFTDEELDYLATFPLITFEKATGRSEGSVQQGTLKAARGVKKRNLKATILYYKNLVIDWGGSSASEELNSIKGGFLKSKDGSYPVHKESNQRKFFDISLPAVRDWWLADAERMLSDPSIDGLFVDANVKILVGGYFAHGQKTGVKKADQIIEGYEKLLSRFDKELRKDHLIFANIVRARFKDGGLGYMSHFDGSYMETFEHNVGGVSKKDYVSQNIAYGQKTARHGKILAFTLEVDEAMNEAVSRVGDDFQADQTFNDRLNYATAIFLVMAEKHSYFLPHAGYGVTKNNRLWLKTPSVFKQKLGPPKGPATKEGYIYRREFEHCSVWLDIENEKATLTWK
ncbi:MAG: putative glycoside hydrolase [Akkermansiaceae bacterium]|nr:putative glycoside hydrolase [Akkermansiaceae bacterium]